VQLPPKLKSYDFLACGGELEAVNELIYERHKRKRVQKSPHILRRKRQLDRERKRGGLSRPARPIGVRLQLIGGTEIVVAGFY